MYALVVIASLMLWATYMVIKPEKVVEEPYKEYIQVRRTTTKRTKPSTRNKYMWTPSTASTRRTVKKTSPTTTNPICGTTEPATCAGGKSRVTKRTRRRRTRTTTPIPPEIPSPETPPTTTQGRRRKKNWDSEDVFKAIRQKAAESEIQQRQETNPKSCDFNKRDNLFKPEKMRGNKFTNEIRTTLQRNSSKLTSIKNTSKISLESTATLKIKRRSQTFKIRPLETEKPVNDPKSRIIIIRRIKVTLTRKLNSTTTTRKTILRSATHQNINRNLIFLNAKATRKPNPTKTIFVKKHTTNQKFKHKLKSIHRKSNKKTANIKILSSTYKLTSNINNNVIEEKSHSNEKTKINNYEITRRFYRSTFF